MIRLTVNSKDEKNENNNKNKYTKKKKKRIKALEEPILANPSRLREQ